MKSKAKNVQMLLIGASPGLASGPSLSNTAISSLQCMLSICFLDQQDKQYLSL